jgi:hypothetical protein
MSHGVDALMLSRHVRFTCSYPTPGYVGGGIIIFNCIRN